MIMRGPIYRFWTYSFGSAVIQHAELNTETENDETLVNVMQMMMEKCEVVKGISDVFGDNWYEIDHTEEMRGNNMRLKEQ